jgi:membrane associated rhomboid family serine protease
LRQRLGQYRDPMSDLATCYRHPDRRTGASCTRCGRPICPDCMIQAPVGHHCPTCVKEDGVRQPRQARPQRWTQPGRTGSITPVVATLIAINVVVFLFTSSRPDIELKYAQIPFRIASGQYYRLITAAFLHANLFHILFNMAALLILGPPIEAALGRVRFLGLYLFAALGGSVCSYLFSSPNVAGVGASGAIFGLFGAYFAIARARRAETGGIVALIGINLVFSFIDPAIDWRAHVGGLVTGVVIGGMFAFAERRPPAQRVAIELATFAAFAGLMLGLVHLRTDQLRVPVA